MQHSTDKMHFSRASVRPLDIFFLAVSVAAAVITAVSAYRNKSGSSVLIIDTPDSEYMYDMSKDRTLSVKGEIGISVIEIKDGKARFVSSPCPNKTCVQCAPINGNNEWIACMPNQVFIRIEKNGDSTETDITAF